MKNKKTFWIILIVFIVLISVSAVVYNSLKDDYKTDNLQTFEVESLPEPSIKEESGSDTQSEVKVESGHTSSTQAPENAAKHAPDFTVFDKNGNAVKLSDFRGKPVVLNFWASWCGPCQMEMPDFEEEYKKQGADVQFLMVNLTDGYQETVSTASSLIASKGYTFPVFYDSHTQAAYAYQVYSIPATYFIDENGYIVAQATGAIDSTQLQQGIERIK